MYHSISNIYKLVSLSNHNSVVHVYSRSVFFFFPVMFSRYLMYSFVCVFIMMKTLFLKVKRGLNEAGGSKYYSSNIKNTNFNE
jgi:hypothetical protein